jgi:hypothetical protein
VKGVLKHLKVAREAMLQARHEASREEPGLQKELLKIDNQIGDLIEKVASAEKLTVPRKRAERLNRVAPSWLERVDE